MKSSVSSTGSWFQRIKVKLPTKHTVAAILFGTGSIVTGIGLVILALAPLGTGEPAWAVAFLFSGFCISGSAVCV